MALGQIYHAPFTTSEWEPLGFRGVIVFGRDIREYEIEDDASWGGSSRDSLVSAETSGSSGSGGSVGGADAVIKDNDKWFRLVEIDPHQKNSSKVVWRQPVLPASSDYTFLTPSFHGFSGNVSVVFPVLLVWLSG